MGILCTLKNINLAFGSKTIFNNAFLTIHQQDKIGLLGLNGKGKSCLLNIIAETIMPDTSTPPFRFDKTKGDGNPLNEFSVFLVPQEVPLKGNENIKINEFLYLFHPQIGKIHKELQEVNQLLAKELHDNHQNLILKQKNLLEKLEHLKGWELFNSYESYLKFFNVWWPNKLIKDLSGGEQKKVLLSLGLSANANLILWDEPTNHLDLETIKLFETELMQSTNKTFIVISHDRYLLNKLTNKILHIDNGEIKNFKGGYSEYLEHLETMEEARKTLLAKLSNSLKRETEWMRQGIKARGCRSKKRVENYQNLLTSVGDIKAQAKKELSLNLHDSKR